MRSFLDDVEYIRPCIKRRHCINIYNFIRTIGVITPSQLAGFADDAYTIELYAFDDISRFNVETGYDSDRWN